MFDYICIADQTWDMDYPYRVYTLGLGYSFWQIPIRVESISPLIAPVSTPL